MAKLEANRSMFEKLIDWLLLMFPNDRTILSGKCKFTGHNWELWNGRAISKYLSYKTRRNYYKCSKCGKERKNL